MKKRQLFLFVLLVMLLITGCSKYQTANDNLAEKGPAIDKKDDSSSEDTETTTPMRDFFLPPGSNAHYQGEGNEFAELKVEVAQPYEKYFVIYENNGAVFVRRTFKIEKDRIDILEETTVDYKNEFPSLDAVQKMKPIGVYLQKPFSLGTAFDDWTIVETDVTVETPYRTFDNAFIIERQEGDAINRKYFVQGFGEVKRESSMTTQDGEVIVTSVLKSVDGVSR